MPKIEEPNSALLIGMEKAKEVVAFVRNTRKEKQLPMREVLTMKVLAKNYVASFDAVIQRLGNLNDIELVTEKPEGAISLITKDAEYYLLLGDLVNADEEIKKLEEELKYTQGFLKSVMKKLSNERFVNNAPEKVVAVEKKKQEDAETKIEALEQQIAALK